MSLTLNMVGGGGGNPINTITVDFYSAAADTVTYLSPVDGLTHTITTDTSGHATAQIGVIKGAPTTIEFVSSIAKDPANLANYYSKAITLTDATDSVYVMPDNFLYWYGVMNSAYGVGDCKTLGYSNGIETYSMTNVSGNTNSFTTTFNDSAQTAGVGTNVLVDLSQFNSIKAHVKSAITAESGKFNGTFYNTAKTVIRSAYFSSSSEQVYTQDISSVSTNNYVGIQSNWQGGMVVYALWLE